MGSLKIYLKLMGLSIKCRTQYRADFITGILSIITLNVIQLGFMGILVYRFNNINTWGIWHILFLYSLWMLGHSIFAIFFWHLLDLEAYVVQGTFDQYFTKPVNIFMQFILQDVQYMGFGDMLIGAAGIVLAYRNLNLDWDIYKAVFFIVSVLSGSIIEIAIMWMCGSVSFWVTRSSPLFAIISQLDSMVQRFPLDVFGTGFRTFVTAFIPVAFINYYPSLVLLHRPGLPGKWSLLSYASPFVGCILLLIAIKIWNAGLKAYSSSGS